MAELDKLESIFPQKCAIPAEYNLPVQVNQTEFLINGKLRNWNGPMQTETIRLRLELQSAFRAPGSPPA